MVGVAKWLRRQVVALEIEGSNPFAHPILLFYPRIIRISNVDTTQDFVPYAYCGFRTFFLKKITRAVSLNPTAWCRE